MYDDALRHRLVARTAARIAHGGLDGVSVRSIATESGTSTSAVYAMFGSKAGLVGAAALAAVESFVAAQEAAPLTQDPMADIHALGLAYRRWAFANPDLYQVMFGGRLPGHGPMPLGFATPDRVGIEPLMAAVVRLVDSGLMRTGSVETIALSIWSAVHGMVSLAIADGLAGSPLADDALYDEHLAVIMRGWAAQVPR